MEKVSSESGLDLGLAGVSDSSQDQPSGHPTSQAKISRDFQATNIRVNNPSSFSNAPLLVPSPVIVLQNATD